MIKGAREHNLKNVDVTIPRDKLIVMTGLSGSGKSSLAFDTIYADGQRRYMESLSSYARQFWARWRSLMWTRYRACRRPYPSTRKTTSRNPRSTVGTVTEIYDYLRLMYARIGIPHCPVCGRIISQQTVDQMVDEVLRLPEGTRFQVLAPVVRGRKGTQQKEFEAARVPALPVCAWMAICTSWTRRSPLKRTRSTRWRSWWTASSSMMRCAAAWRIPSRRPSV